MKIKLKFKPLFWPTVFLLFTLPILIGLGTWQVKRLFWKEKLLNFYITQSQSNIIELPQEILSSEKLKFRTATVKGIFLNDKEIHLTGKTFEGNAGFHVVTPFEMLNKQIILVNRGWVPEKYKNPDDRNFSLIHGKTKLKGIIRYPEKKGYFVPNNQPKDNFWITINPNEIKKYFKFNKNNFIEKFYIDVLRDEGKLKIPIGANFNPNLRNQHFSYAIIWYSLALTLVIIYFVFHKSENRLILKRKIK